MFKYLIPFLITVTVFIVLIFFSFKLITPDTVIYKKGYGVSFSPNLISYLGLDPQVAYLSILDDLKVKQVRIPSFWEKIQPSQDEFDFSQTDFMVDAANLRGVKLIFVLGIKQPRWPECHIPQWAKNLSVEERQKAVIKYIEKTVDRYKYSTNIWAWQVENEPLFGFGENCPKLNKDFLKQEIQLVKAGDSTRPIIVTDTGEWESWINTMKAGDILGISVYHKAYNPFLGYITYPFPSFFYSLKSDLIRSIFASNNKKTIITELQAEPWVKNSFLGTSFEDQIKLFSVDDFKKNVIFAQSIGFDDTYLWGAEWWYFMKENKHPEYWNFAKTLF